MGKENKVRVIERYYAEGEWEAESALHLGGESGDEADMVLLRDSAKQYFVPGSSIAGAARNHLQRAKGGETNEFRALFGGNRTDPGGRQYASLLTVFDAPLQSPGATLRDGVRIDPRNGQAEDEGKYNMEVLLKGTKFKMKMLLAIYDELPFGVTKDDLTATFRTVLGSFAEGHIGLGARTRRGLGRGKVAGWSVRRLDPAIATHALAWLRQKFSDGEEMKHALDAVELSEFVIDAKLALQTSLLVRGPGETFRDPDMMQLTEHGVVVLPGSSIAGALRHRCERIAYTLGLNQAVVNSMFGPRAGSKQPKAGHLSVREVHLLEGGDPLVQGRVTIDRFTGGALSGRLFDEAPFYPRDQKSCIGHFEFRLETNNPEEVRLLALAFKDLWLGDLPFGGEVGVGRGVFRGVRATITVPGKGCFTMTALDTGLQLNGDNAALEEFRKLTGVAR